MTDMTYDRQLVDRLAEEFVERYRAGERPSLDEYVAAHPGHADEIRDLFPALVMIEELAPSEDSSSGAATAPCVTAAPLERVGDYRILREVGRGGMGVVYEAEQESLSRRVALKILHLQAGQDPRVLARFRRESRAAARLHHTNIVPVFEVGQEGGVCYYAMQFIQGQALDEVLKELQKLRSVGPVIVTEALPADAERVARSLWTGRFEPASQERHAPHESPAPDASGLPLPDASRPPAAETERVVLDATLSSVESNYRLYCRNVARIGLQVAEALTYAHARGVVHRDIKPSNLLFDTAGVVWVSDFGLAKTRDPGLTDSGDIVGTVRYMAPERFQGECDARADLYALGLTLYELLVLRPAFDGQDRLHLMKQITRHEPARLRAVDPRIPRDLETVVMKALEKEPRRRYASADEMAEDLRRFLSDRPIQARPIRVWERAFKWAKRRPAVAGLAATLLGAVVGLLGLGTWSYARIEQALAQEMQQRRNAEGAREDAVKKSDALLAENYSALLSATRAARLTLTPGWREEALDNLRRLTQMDTPRRDLVELRTEAVACLGERDARTATRLVGHTHYVVAVDFSPDGATLASGSADGSVRLWDAATGRQLAEFRDPAHDASKLRSPENPGPAVRFRPDGGLLSSTWRQRVDFLERKEDNKTLVCREGFVPPPGTTAPPRSLSLDAKGRLLAIGWGDGVVGVYDRAGGLKHVVTTKLRDLLRTRLDQAGKPARPLDRNDTSWKFPVALSPDGALLATSAPGYVVHLHTLPETKDPLLLGKHRAEVHGFVFSPDGGLLASNSEDGTVRLWDVHGGKEKLVLAGHSSRVCAVAFCPQGDLLATASEDGTARLWETQTGLPVLTLRPGPGALFSVAFSPDGTRMAVGGAISLDVYHLPNRTERRRLATSVPMCLVFQPGKAVLAVGTFLEDIHRWDLGPGQAGKPLPDLPNPVNDTAKPIGLMAYNSHGRLLAVASPPPSEHWVTSADASIHVLDAETGKILKSLKSTSGRATSLEFDPPGRLLASAATDGKVRVWDVATGEVTQSWSFPSLLGGPPIAFASNGAELIAGGLTGQVVVREVSTGKIVRETAFPGGLTRIAVAADESRLAVAGVDGRVRIVSLPDLHLLATLERAHESIITQVAFAADSRLLATAGMDRKVALWDARAFRHLFDLPPQNNFVNCLAFQSDGFRLAVGAWENLAMVWDLALLRPELAGIGLDWDKSGAPRTPPADFQRGQFQGLPIEMVVLGLNYILKTVPDQAEFTNELTWIHVAGPEKLRDAKKALPLAQKAVDLAPNEPLCLNTLGVTYYRLGEWQKARDTLRKAAEMNSRGATAYDHYFLALCHHQMGQADQARTEYEQAKTWREQAKLTANQAAELAVIGAEADAVFVKEIRPAKK